MISFLKYKWLYFLISATVICTGLFSIIRFGYKFSIDFVGGTDLEYRFNKPISEKTLTDFFRKQNIKLESISKVENDYLIRTVVIGEKEEANIRHGIEKDFSVAVTLMKSETVGPRLGRETLIKTLIAGLIGILGILVYMSFAFKGFNFALAAILAMLHDFLVVVGGYSLLSYFFGAQVDTMFVTAILTTMSFSVHDTIIIFDKIREYMRVEGRADMESYADRALVETMVRSLNNSMTILFMLLALTLLGGYTIRFFIATLLIGTITGTYSSPFVATPILVYLERRRK